MFTAVFEKKRGAFLAKSGLTPAGFAAANKEAAGKGLALTSVDAYGTPGDIRYVGVWSAGSGGAWQYTYGKSLKQHEAEFYAKKEKGFRPVRIAVAPDGTYAAVWRKDGVKSWAHYVDMSASGYQKRFDDLKAKARAGAGQRGERQVRRHLAVAAAGARPDGCGRTAGAAGSLGGAPVPRPRAVTSSGSGRRRSCWWPRSSARPSGRSRPRNACCPPCSWPSPRTGPRAPWPSPCRRASAGRGWRAERRRPRRWPRPRCGSARTRR
ncbi:hypothetical protein ACFQQB_32400 [Nonomuraea rubra]|uniref:hypothetical protein n=1 Tax=Nonomuraea rubra TaxID=46180 RepID=UPI0036122728